MGDRLGIAHSIRTLFGVTATPGALSAGQGGLTPTGIDLAAIRGRLHRHAATSAPAVARHDGGMDRRDRADIALGPRSSLPWTL